MSRDAQAPALADALQAHYFRGYLKRQRSLLARKLAKHVNDLTGLPEIVGTRFRGFVG
jgi:hypothetical protein